LDANRKFIIQVHLEDDTFQIREPPIRNSGHKGGIFLSRCKLETHDGSKPLQPGDIYLGGDVDILSHKFTVLNCDQFTFKFMEENSKIWRYCNLESVLQKTRPKKEVLKRLVLTFPGLASRNLTVEELQEICDKAGMNLVKQEVCTLFRAVDLARVGVVKMTHFLKYLMDMK
jgi:EF-hand domain-containing protein 1